MGELNRTLENGRGWVACEKCGLPCILSESFSANNTVINHGCANCLMVRVRVLEGHRNQWRRIAGRLHDAADLTSGALANMGAEERANYDTPQVVRDLCRHHSTLLRQAMAFDEPEE